MVTLNCFITLYTKLIVQILSKNERIRINYIYLTWDEKYILYLTIYQIDIIRTININIGYIIGCITLSTKLT